MCVPCPELHHSSRDHGNDVYGVTVRTNRLAGHWQLQGGNRLRCNLVGKPVQRLLHWL